MAIENAKTLQVRIKNKYDSYQNWMDSGLILEAGEIAIAHSSVDVAVDNGVAKQPVLLMKVGNGTDTFSALPWLSAKAADVLECVKSEAGLTAFINTVIAGAGMATDDAMKALTTKVTTAEGEIDTLQLEMDAVEAKAAANETAIAGLKTLVGDTGVAAQISKAIEELKLAETYAAKSLETTVANHVADEVAHVTTADKTTWNAALQAANIATGSANGTISVKGADVAVKGLGSAAFTEASAYEVAGAASAAETAAKTYAKEYADGLAGNYDAKGSAAAAQAAAEAYADGLAKNYDAAGAAGQALVDAKAYTDAEIKEWVGDETVAAQIAALDLANSYDAKGAAAAAESAAKAHANGLNTAMNTRVEALEAIDHDHSNKAVLDGITAEKVTAWDAAEGNAKAHATGLNTAIDTRVKALEDKFTGDDSVADQIEAAVAAEAELREAADTALGNRVKAVEDELNTAQTGLKARMTAAEGEIDALQGVIGEVTSVADYVAGEISAAVAAEAEIARAAEKANADAIKAIADDYLVEADKTELIGAIATAKQEAIATVLGEGTDADFDTLKEVADWILSDTTGAAALQTDVAAIKADYLKAADKTELEGKITAAQNAADKAQGEVDALEEVVATKAAQADLTTLTGRVSTAEGKITALEGKMETAEGEIDAIQGVIGEVKSVADYVAGEISAAITAENLAQYAKVTDLNTANGKIATAEGKIETLEGKMETAEGKITTLEGEVAKKTNDADLATIAKTGSTDDLVQGSLVLIFDCGTSAE